MIVRHGPWRGRGVPRVRLALRLERLFIESSLGHAPLLGGDLLHQRGELLLLLLLGSLDALEDHISKYDTNLDGTFSVAEVKAIRCRAHGLFRR